MECADSSAEMRVKMITPTQTFQNLKKNIKLEWKIAFFTTFIIGLLVHMPILLSDIPNHDGLDSMYFSQNMITSGRWFLAVACGFSSYFTIPWVIGILGLFFLACAAVALTELLELRDKVSIMITGGLLAVFPALASTFAYVFTLDGYMLALFLAVLSVLLTKKYRCGFVGGAICLAFSMGIYQAYLSFAVLLSIYMILLLLMEEGALKDKFQFSVRYLYMGGLGVVLYFVILQVLLKIQGKELASYQGINSMGSAVGNSFLSNLKNLYDDFVSFTVKGNVLFNNVFSLMGFVLLAGFTMTVIAILFIKRKWWKNMGFFAIIVLLAVGLPVATNIILIVSPEVTYHLLMRYQWVLYLILMVDFISRYTDTVPTRQMINTDKGSAHRNDVYEEEAAAGKSHKGKAVVWMEWGVLLAAAVLIFNYAVTDNIAYSNLQKRYEKTYAYCVRLLDRIEQTDGYYQGIPIAMIGVVGDEQFPTTDITWKVTSNMIGMNGDSLLYTGFNYQAFMKHYLGATLNFLEPEVMSEIYYSEEYVMLDSFPGRNSTKVVDGILYVKTENVNRD